MATGQVLLEMRGIAKHYPGVQALRGVDFTLQGGEVHALLGVNGAGKSTLVKIMGGAEQPDGGEILVGGELQHFRTVADAVAAGIVVVHQERTLIPHLSVMDNVMLGAEARRGWLLNKRAMAAEVKRLMATMQIELPLHTPAKDLGAGERQLVDILRALRGNPRVIVLDEPTAALSKSEADHLFTVIRRFLAHGIGVVFVSHRLDEVFAISDRFTILRDGQVVAEATIKEKSPREVARLMVGRDVSLSAAAVEREHSGPPLLRTVDLCGPRFRNVCIEVYPGEIIGLAGAVGAGRTELMETIFGNRRAEGGTVLLRDTETHIRSPYQAAQLGIVLVPEKRTEKGLIERAVIRENLSLPSLPRFAAAGFLRRPAERSAANAVMEDLSIAAPHAEFAVRNLSGGNKQKVVVGKWLLASQQLAGKLFLFDEPTEGVDVGVKAEMWARIHQLAAQGAGIIVTSSEIEELHHLCNRIYVMRHGEIVGSGTVKEMTQARISELMLTSDAHSDASSDAPSAAPFAAPSAVESESALEPASEKELIP